MTEENIEKKKRGRKKKSEKDALQNNANNNIFIVIEETDAAYENNTVENEEVIIKKRGRKPKGGKLILKQSEKINNLQNVSNIILHLKCSLQDLNEHNDKLNKIVKNPLSYNPIVPPSIMSYNIKDTPCFSIYDESIHNKETNIPNLINSINNNAYEDNNNNENIIGTYCKKCNQSIEKDKDIEFEFELEDINIKDINSKLKTLKLELYKNMNTDKKSACFWCTYDFDNQTCYIPKYELDGKIYGYGSFCRPECAVAFLMKENIDDSMKFERYHLLNQIYSKVYNFKKNIKPAPNPYYLLEKYYGNLSIQEYRKLLKTEHMLLVIDKPMTRILPELHEDNDDFIMNIYGSKNENMNQNTGIYKVRKSNEKQKGPSKNTIIKENFGIS